MKKLENLDSRIDTNTSDTLVAPETQEVPRQISQIMECGDDYKEKQLISFQLTNIPKNLSDDDIMHHITELIHIIGFCKISDTEAEVVIHSTKGGAVMIRNCIFMKNKEILKFPFFKIGRSMENKVIFQGDQMTFVLKKGLLSKSKLNIFFLNFLNFFLTI